MNNESKLALALAMMPEPEKEIEKIRQEIIEKKEDKWL